MIKPILKKIKKDFKKQQDIKETLQEVLEKTCPVIIRRPSTKKTDKNAKIRNFDSFQPPRLINDIHFSKTFWLKIE